MDKISIFGKLDVVDIPGAKETAYKNMMLDSGLRKYAFGRINMKFCLSR